MSRLAPLALLLCVTACSWFANAGDDGGAPLAASSASEGGVASDSGSGQAGAGEAGVAPSREELLEIFLEAARTNLEKPHPESDPESQKRYAEARGALSNRAPDLGPWSVAFIVAHALAESDDGRAHHALMGWAGEPAAKPHLPDMVGSMQGYPRDEYLAVCKAILADEAAAGVIVEGPFAVRGGLLGKALYMDIKASLQVMALELAVALPGPAGKDLVRGIAMDRAASAPKPKTLSALQCDAGEKRVEAEAQALASLRIMALSTLGDRALLSRVAADPSETTFVRHWARRMRAGGPDGEPGWEKRLDPRQKQAFEQSMMEYVPPVVSPCFTAHPRPILPSPK